MNNNYTVLLEKISFSLIVLKRELRDINITDVAVQNTLLDIRKQINMLGRMLDNGIQGANVASGMLRSVDETYQLIVLRDPKTSLTKSGLRKLIANGTIPHVKVGRNIKLDYDSVVNALRNGTASNNEQNSTGYGGMRKIG